MQVILDKQNVDFNNKDDQNVKKYSFFFFMFFNLYIN